MDGWYLKFVKLLMVLFNFAFWASGFALIIGGGMIRSQYGDYFTYADNKYASVEVLVILIGVSIFIIGFLGCCGSLKESYCMMATFCVVISLIFVLEIAAGVLAYQYNVSMETTAGIVLKRAVKRYDKETGAKQVMDWTQKSFSCCGDNGPNDYDATRGQQNFSPCGAPGKAIPSCHKNSNCTNQIFNTGCRSKFLDFVRDNMLLICLALVAVAFVELFGVHLSICLIRGIDLQKNST